MPFPRQPTICHWAEIFSLLETQQGNICIRLLLFPYPKVNQLLPYSEEPLGTDAHTQVQVVGLPAQIACSRDSARDLRISAFD
ncbi:MAG: hypothetical protein ACYTXT_36585 [Nostoc sp.]